MPCQSRTPTTPGDDWEHMLVHESMEPADPAQSYPRCVSGARRCPPEGCGGPDGYARFLVAIANRRHPEHKAMLTWAGGPVDPDAFDPMTVRFDDPQARWQQTFDNREQARAGGAREP